MKYSSLREIKDKFHLDSDDLDILHQNLKALLLKFHPNANKGEFKDDVEKEKYHDINDAMSYIDYLKNNNHLMVIEKMTDIVKAVIGNLPNTKEISLQNNVENKINFAITKYKSGLFIPKISFTGITVFLSFLYAIPKQNKDNPIIFGLFSPQSSIFEMFWFECLAFTLLLWLFAYWNEENEKHRLSLLKVDSTQNEIFLSFIKQTPSNYFTKDEMTEFIFGRRPRRKRLFSMFGKAIVTMEIAQSISEIIIDRAEKKGLILKSEINTLSDNYIIKNWKGKDF